MGSLTGYLLVYVLGGVTFIPVVFGLLIFHAWLTLPRRENGEIPDWYTLDGIQRPTDSQATLQTATDALAEKFQRIHETDVAAGYFTVCREYVPGGLNGKPPERTTPAGEVITPESPSVYQSMYRSIFDRRNSTTVDHGKVNGKNNKKGRNVFYIVLRHGHLMLYDDSEQMEVRYVISLSHHDVEIYSGGEPIPEGELWIKRNAIRLSRKLSPSDATNPQMATLPFYLFSENPSEKEDLYFAILKNLEKLPESPNSPPTAQHFDAKDIVNLVKGLHSSEENLHTRWFNALIGRLFLSVYKTTELESHIWTKISKKISRVKKPNFITRIILRKINAGGGIPLITNPRLKDLTVDGDCCVEADLTYNGNFRIEIAATARIDLGARFKAREVDLVLAVVLKRLKGHGLLRFKPPPSNRAWFSFETMPEMEMNIEPIVSSMQITYGVILRAIESRIREVVGETLVQPFWDDIPFLDTSLQRYRGGIWQETSAPSHDQTTGDDIQVEEHTAEILPDDVLSNDEQTEGVITISSPLSPALDWRSKSSPALDTCAGVTDINRSEPVTISRKMTSQSNSSVTYGSLESVSNEKLDDNVATSTMIDSPTSHSPRASLHHRSVQRSPSFQKSSGSSMDGRTRADSIVSQTSSNSIAENSETDLADPKNRKTTQQSPSSKPGPNTLAPSANPLETRQTMGSLGSVAAAAAKKWGWNVLGRVDQFQKGTDRTPVNLDHPMGRGRPLPPPGTPLPPPERSLFRTSTVSLPKRKPLAPRLFPETVERTDLRTVKLSEPNLSRHRDSDSSSIKTENDEAREELLIIKAPASSDRNIPFVSETPLCENIKPNDECLKTSFLPVGTVQGASNKHDASKDHPSTGHVNTAPFNIESSENKAVKLE
ncbi:hypothetical protein LOZ12_002237 [Ophidiomyces ophidiicola]|uniref:Uncharacterized protein n=1 Tax=Ophidiomyces ophidiicola TaxID=1387563 RepID=A0ACB8UYR4_9EURO|nr:uncharacterized protein LOZ57_001921 [Ophidiomyces ophidiicola]KAI1919801.1 hypothetical protein LOZ64_002064 [Ophidiomyces ophidiicola]KAI1950062.1 hypothetical protein LOZ62_002045 [Ophidiomyces ophidiicola]KAI1950362.1 hypothetical protein LOZ57_001921 [Ophidiomyces ophidiicola]KAI1959459.1 hypothetical protein LOZ59_003062 [Ophidiomyces ophidiicola]KAI1973798.1 hypothetical protein LOZ56_001654 [Ophidiomyces ophidiicola]